jgi:hypothetical protein
MRGDAMKEAWTCIASVIVGTAIASSLICCVTDWIDANAARKTLQWKEKAEREREAEKALDEKIEKAVRRILREKS